MSFIYLFIPLHKANMVLPFNKSIFNYYFIEYSYIFWIKWYYQALPVFFSAFKFVLWNMLILYFYIFQRGFEVLNATFQVFVYATIVTASVYFDMYHC